MLKKEKSKAIIWKFFFLKRLFFLKIAPSGTHWYPVTVALFLKKLMVRAQSEKKCFKLICMPDANQEDVNWKYLSEERLNTKVNSSTPKILIPSFRLIRFFKVRIYECWWLKSLLLCNYVVTVTLYCKLNRPSYRRLNLKVALESTSILNLDVWNGLLFLGRPIKVKQRN